MMTPWREGGSFGPGFQFTADGHVKDAGEEDPRGRFRAVSPGFFAALDRCEQLLQEANVPASLHDDVRLVLEELMVNTVEYGYPDGRPGRIRVVLQPRPGATTIELRPPAST